jgi:hypothetical protein
MELIKTPQTEIKSFLYNSINIEIYNKLKKIWLTNEENIDLDEKILKLFNLIYSEAEYYIQNDNDYLAIIEHYINLDCFIYEMIALSNLNIIINEVYKTNNPNEIQLKSFQFIKEHFNSFVDSKENDLQIILDSYSLHKFRNRINCYKNDEEKINYLIEIKYRFLQEVIDYENWESNNSFDKKCDIEIDKLKSKIKIESIEKLNEINKDTQNIDNTNKSKKDLSTQKWFKVGIALANGTAFEVYNKQKAKNNINFTEICRQIRVLESNKTYIIDTINNNDSVKNLFSNKEKLEALHKYLTDNQLEFGKVFLEKYNQIERD